MEATGFEAVGQLVKRAREEAGMTQAQLADAAGLTNGAQSISRYERGEVNVPMPRLRLIAMATGKPLSFFVGESETATPSPPTLLLWSSFLPLLLETEMTADLRVAVEAAADELERSGRETLRLAAALRDRLTRTKSA